MNRMSFLMGLAFLMVGGAGIAQAQPASPPVVAPQATPEIVVAAPVAADAAVMAEIQQVAAKVVSTFNTRSPEEVAKLFIPNGEWIDENGTVYQGRQSIQDLLTAYFEQYPDVEISLDVEDVRMLGPLAIEEGTRTMSVGNGAAQALVHYVAVLAKTDAGWQFASVRDTSRETQATSEEALQQLAWLVGSWVNHSSQSSVQLTYRWSDDHQFLLGNYVVHLAGQPVMQSEHRIGWDPSRNEIRSWVFDADGGFGEGRWVRYSDGWLIHSTAVVPDGRSGSAVITLMPENENRFTMTGTHRILGDEPEADFEITVVREAPRVGSTQDQ